jgi:hypothetical protein
MRCWIIFLLLSSTAYGQKAAVREIKLLASEDYLSPKEKYPTIIYPVILLKNTITGKLINDAIEKEVLESENPGHPRKELLEQISNGLTDVSYEITFNKNNLLSLHIYAQESGGNHLADRTSYFNFDLQTGRDISLSDLFIKGQSDPFQAKVLADRNDSINQYKKDAASLLQQNEIDSTVFQELLQQVNDEYLTMPFDNFILSSRGIEIIDDRVSPPTIRAYTASFRLRYAFTSIQLLLDPKYRRLFLKY